MIVPMFPRVAILIFALLGGAAAQYQANLCDPGSKYGTINITFDKLRLAVSAPKRDKDDSICSFRVIGPTGKVLARDEQLGILQPQYVDLDGDGVPELIVVADSGGSGGYHNSYIFSQVPHPMLLIGIRDSC